MLWLWNDCCGFQQIESTIELWKIEVQIWINPKTLWFFLIQRIRLWNLLNFWTFDSCVYFSSQVLAHGARDICKNTRCCLFFTPKNTTHVLKLWANSSKQHTTDMIQGQGSFGYQTFDKSTVFSIIRNGFFQYFETDEIVYFKYILQLSDSFWQKTAFSLK